MAPADRRLRRISSLGAIRHRELRQPSARREHRCRSAADGLSSTILLTLRPTSLIRYVGAANREADRQLP